LVLGRTDENVGTASRSLCQEPRMLKELTKTDWLALLGIPEERTPDVLVLRGTRNLKTHY